MLIQVGRGMLQVEGSLIKVNKGMLQVGGGMLQVCKIVLQLVPVGAVVLAGVRWKIAQTK